MSINAQSITAGIKKYPVLVICGIVGIALLVLLYLRSDLLSAQQAELDKYVAEGSRYQANIANAAQLQEQLNFLVQANQAVKARTLSAESLAQNLQYFYRLESEVGVKTEVRSGARTATPKSATYVPLNYIVNLQGDLKQMLTYVRHMERGAYFSRINAVSVTKNDSAISLNLNVDLLGAP